MIKSDVQQILSPGTFSPEVSEVKDVSLTPLTTFARCNKNSNNQKGKQSHDTFFPAIPHPQVAGF
jgi:hypothetical protein